MRAELYMHPKHGSSFLLPGVPPTELCQAAFDAAAAFDAIAVHKSIHTQIIETCLAALLPYRHFKL